MEEKNIFETYFKGDLLEMGLDRVSNVRLRVGQVVKEHFEKEVGNEFIYDNDVNDLVRVLKQDGN